MYLPVLLGGVHNGEPVPLDPTLGPVLKMLPAPEDDHPGEWGTIEYVRRGYPVCGVTLYVYSLRSLSDPDAMALMWAHLLTAASAVEL